MHPLSPGDEKLLGLIRAHVKAHGFPPSVKEIRIALGLKSNCQAHGRISRLVAKGYLKRTRYRARGLELVQTEDYHLPNCNCLGCCQARYRADLQLVKALQVPYPFPPTIRLNGLRRLTDADRIAWCVKGYIPGNKVAASNRAAIPTEVR